VGGDQERSHTGEKNRDKITQKGTGGRMNGNGKRERCRG